MMIVLWLVAVYTWKYNKAKDRHSYTKYLHLIFQFPMLFCVVYIFGGAGGGFFTLLGVPGPEEAGVGGG